jgi:hypothetical protein
VEESFWKRLWTCRLITDDDDDERLIMCAKYKYVMCKNARNIPQCFQLSFQAMGMHVYAFDYQFDTPPWLKNITE